MRTIKFRAWDGQEMLNDWLVMERGGTQIVARQLARAAEVVMQFTGLLDKNGKEIYEGDIIEWEVRPGTKDRMAMEFFSDLQTWKPYINQTSEVIGNIYSNPELLQ